MVTAPPPPGEPAGRAGPAGLAGPAAGVGAQLTTRTVIAVRTAARNACKLVPPSRLLWRGTLFLAANPCLTSLARSLGLQTAAFSSRRDLRRDLPDDLELPPLGVLVEQVARPGRGEAALRAEGELARIQEPAGLFYASFQVVHALDGSPPPPG
jgi:hypothetical protein